jgi:undecaprenyl pyrophosphate phosphatase UppP
LNFGIIFGLVWLYFNEFYSFIKAVHSFEKLNEHTRVVVVVVVVVKVVLNIDTHENIV